MEAYTNGAVALQNWGGVAGGLRKGWAVPAHLIVEHMMVGESPGIALIASDGLRMSEHEKYRR